MFGYKFCRLMRQLIILLFLLFAVTVSHAQQSPRNNPSEIPSSRDPEVKESKRKPEQNKVSKKRSRGSNDITVYYDVKVKEFHKRMEANAKRHRKMQNEMQKPQYSDPMYFGHKKMPKKRPPGKKKFCRECRMVH
jgi:archaellum component FlaD/FlaE